MLFFYSGLKNTSRLMATVTVLAFLNGCGGGGSGGATQRLTGPESAQQNNDGRRFSVQLEWSIPLARTNGDVLYVNELVGYEILYSNEFDTSPRQLRIDDPLQTEMDLTDLPAGQYYFAVAAIDEHGTYSDFSTPIEITLQ